MLDEPASQRLSEEDTSDAQDAGEGSGGSLLEDVGTLVEEGRNYVEAELAFQKTRFSYVLSHAKWAVLFLGTAAVLGLLALFALTFGLLLALSPIITPMGATIAVTFSLLLSAVALTRFAKWQLQSMMKGFGAGGDGKADSKDKE